MNSDDRRSPPTSDIITSLKDHEVDERVRYKILEDRLEKIEIAIGEMLDMWKGAKGVLYFLKVAAAIGSTLAALALWAKDHVKL